MVTQHETSPSSRSVFTLCEGQYPADDPPKKGHGRNLRERVGREVPCHGLQTIASEEDRHRHRRRWAALAPRRCSSCPWPEPSCSEGKPPGSDLPGARAAGATTAVDGRRAAQARGTGRWHRRRTRYTAGHPWAACRKDRREPLRPTASYRRTRVSADSSEPSSHRGAQPVEDLARSAAGRTAAARPQLLPHGGVAHTHGSVLARLAR